MAQISKKPLTDLQSNLFLESKGLKNIVNSFEGSAWRFPQLNIIISIDIDTVCRTEDDFIKLIYNIGYENGFNYCNTTKDFESAIK